MGEVEKITVVLTKEMVEFVRGAVDNGDYASTSEAIREAVREWKERREFLGYTIEDLRDLAQEGVASGPSGRATIAEVKVEARRRRELKSMRDA